MTKRSLLYSRNCWVEGKIQPALIVIENDLIAGIETKFYKSARDFGELILMPGVIDAHVHINEPGRTDWEGFDSACRAAASGGITSIIDMPLNSSPVTTSLPALRKKLNASEGKSHVNIGFYGGLIPSNAGDLSELLTSGILGIKCFLTHSGIDEFPNVTESDLQSAMPMISQSGLPLLAHCEISDRQHEGELSGNPSSYTAYLSSRPDEWELSAINLVLRLAEENDCRLHIVHVSSGKSLDLIEAAKRRSGLVTAETCPHYLLFSSEEISDGQTIFKCAPPIRTWENNLSLKKSFSKSILDFVASDHSPAPPEIKQITSGNFQKAWGGIAGLQFLLPASWTSLKNHITMEAFIPLLTEHPARFLGLEKSRGFLKAGAAADLVAWAPGNKFVVNSEEIFHKHKPTPYLGVELAGEIRETYVNGSLVYSNKEIINLNKGKWLLKK